MLFGIILDVDEILSGQGAGSGEGNTCAGTGSAAQLREKPEGETGSGFGNLMDLGLASLPERAQVSTERDRAKRQQDHPPPGEEDPSQIQDKKLRIHDYFASVSRKTVGPGNFLVPHGE